MIIPGRRVQQLYTHNVTTTQINAETNWGLNKKQVRNIISLHDNKIVIRAQKKAKKGNTLKQGIVQTETDYDGYTKILSLECFWNASSEYFLNIQS